MFNVLARPTFTRTVKVSSPDGDGLREDSFVATFVWVPSDELQAFETDTTEGIKDLLRDVIVSAADLVGDNDERLEWSSDLLEGLLAWSNVRAALLLAYNSAWVEEKRGN